MFRRDYNAAGERIDRYGMVIPEKPKQALRERFGLYKTGAEKPGLWDVKTGWKIALVGLVGLAAITATAYERLEGADQPVVPHAPTSFETPDDCTIADTYAEAMKTDPSTYAGKFATAQALCLQETNATAGVPGLVPTSN